MCPFQSNNALIFPVCVIAAIPLLVCNLYLNNELLLVCSIILLVTLLISKITLFRLVFIGVSLIAVMIYYFFGLFFMKLWKYANPTPGLGFPNWEPLVWAIGYIACADLAHGLYYESKNRLNRKISLAIDQILLIIILIYTALTLMLIDGYFTKRFLLILPVIFLLKRRPYNIFYFGVIAVLGPLVDFIHIQKGVYFFFTPYFHSTRIPLSLSLAYGLTANIIWFVAMLLTNAWDKETGFEVIKGIG